MDQVFIIMQDQSTHPDLRKYTEWLQTLAGGAGGRIGSWLGLTAFGSQSQAQIPSSGKHMACRLLSRLLLCVQTCCLPHAESTIAAHVHLKTHACLYQSAEAEAGASDNSHSETAVYNS